MSTETEQMRIKAFVPYFGGKRNLAPKIVELLGKHRVYWEPFCGSLAVLLAKEPCVMETACDLYGDVVNLALVLQDPEMAAMLYCRVAHTLMAEPIFKHSANVFRADRHCNNMPDPDRAYHFFVASWLGRNGCAGSRAYNYSYCVRYSSNGGHAATRWRNAAESIPAWHNRSRNVTILNRDALDIIDRIEDKAGTVVYIDPPYFEKGSEYIHDFTDENHIKLAELLAGFKRTRVIVSYYDHPKLDQLYPGWARHDITVTKALANQNRLSSRNKAVKATEVLLVNQHDGDGGLFE